MRSEIHAVIRTHGEALAGSQEQPMTFNGGCNPQCDNVQATLQMPLLAGAASAGDQTSAAEVHQFPAEETNVVDRFRSFADTRPRTDNLAEYYNRSCHCDRREASPLPGRSDASSIWSSA